MSVEKIRSRYKLIPIVIAVGIIPLIMRLHVYTNDVLAGYPWFSDADHESADVFLWGKSCALQILGAVILLLLLDRFIIQGKRPEWKRTFFLPAVYIVMVILSGIMSHNRNLAFKGSYERFEPVGVIAAYLLIFFYSYTAVKTEKDMTALLKSLAVCLIPMFLLGFFQSIGFDLLGQPAIKRLLVSTEYKDSLDNLILTRDTGLAYLTLYNENYLGMYFGIMIPVFISLFFASKKIYIRIISITGFFLSSFILLHASSSTGWIALGLSAYIMMWILMGKGKKGVAGALLVTALLVVITVAAVFLLPGVRNRVDKAFHEGRGRVHKITGLETEDNEAVFTFFFDNELHVKFDFAQDGTLIPDFKDRDGNDLLYREEDGIFVLDECFEYADAAVTAQKINGRDAAVFLIDEHKWPLLRGEDGGYYYLNPALRADKVSMDDGIKLLSDSFLSGRGAIWNSCLPLMLKHLFLGSGANTFITEFPQNDYVSMNYRLGWGTCEYNVKAHSFYINDWIENGMIADVCIIIFFISYLIKGAGIYRRAGKGLRQGDIMTVLGLGMYAGCLTYMIAALVNDSNVCTAPVFWAVLGISMSVNESLNNNLLM